MIDKVLLGGAASLVGAFSVAAQSLPLIGATPEIQAHNRAVTEMTTHSIARCSPQQNQMFYYSRLATALDTMSTEALNTLKDNNITVCLDSRLARQVAPREFPQLSYNAVFYGDRNVLAIPDNGREFNHSPNVYQENPAYRAHRSVDQFAEKLREGDIKNNETYFMRSWSTASKHGRSGASVETEAEIRADRSDLYGPAHIERNGWMRDAPEAMIRPENRPVASVSANFNF